MMGGGDMNQLFFSGVSLLAAERGNFIGRTTLVVLLTILVIIGLIAAVAAVDRKKKKKREK